MDWRITLLFLTICNLSNALLQAQDCNSQTINLLQSSASFGYGIPSIQDPPGYLAPAPYTFTAAVPPAQGEYAIVNSTAGWGGPAVDWVPTGDNSITPIGYMMVLNSTLVPDTFWRETLPLCADGDYIISFDAINLYSPLLPPQSPPNFDFYVNGALVTNFGNLPSDGQWHNFNTFFTVNTVANTSFELFNNTIGGPGNVFAIDNIRLTRCGPELSLTEINPIFHCPGDSIEMTVTLGPNNYPAPWFQWQLSTDGGQNWGNYGNPTNNLNSTIYNLPIAAQLRLAAAPTQADLSNPFCVTYSGPFPVAFLPPEQCSNAISSIGGLCSGNQGPNSLPNGDFGSGIDNILPFDPGYAPGYTYEFNPPPDDGTYTITNNTSNWGSFAADSWINIYDNSPDTNGYMMVVNASPDPGLFYEQTIPVCENTLYEFSCDVISMNWPIFIGTLAEPNISFLIDGVEVFASGNVPIDSTWRTFGFSITTAPGVNQLTLGLRNNTPGGFTNIGNDLAIDNISFRACGPDISISEVSSPPYCIDKSATLTADIGPGFDSPELQWQISIDGGLNWQNLGNQIAQDLDSLKQTMLVRVLVAETIGNLLEENCRLVSDTFNLEVYPAVQTNLYETICQGQSYTFGNQVLYNSSIYQLFLTTVDGCDSLIRLDLNVELLTGTDSVSICKGQSYTFGPQTIYDAGTYQETFTTPDGCDSLVTLTLEVYQLTGSDTAAICKGQAYIFGSKTIYDAGTYEETFTTPDGCDSTVTLTLDVYELSGTDSVMICQGQSYPFGMQTLYSPGIYKENFVTADGCDSLVTILLEVSQLSGVETAAICEGDAYIFGMQTVYNAGTYQENFVTTDGCDSLVTLTLSVEDIKGFELTGDTVLCPDETGTLRTVNTFDSYNWSTGDSTPTTDVSKSGWFAVTVTSALGCTAINSIFVAQPQILINPQITDPLCLGDRNGRIDITDHQGATPFQFSLDNAPFQNDSSFTGLSADQYTIAIMDAAGCTADTIVSLQDPPAIGLDIGPDLVLNFGDTVLLNSTTSMPVVQWQWTPPFGLSCSDCPDPIATPVSSTNYTLLVTDTDGCTAEATINLEVKPEPEVYIPNVFMPNSDGENAFFSVIASDGVVLIKRFDVFDRWGNHVFSAPENLPPNSPGQEWDGTYQGKNLPPAVFVWYAEIEFAHGKTKMYSGDVTLLR